ncbi:glucose 1-dehydrogenase [Marinobacterium sp. MBR-109]|jgi:7-alpha-hydroxysteroid dehydrogenase|uniref:glucose 1-dehydrogenase n=1 Tax=Marinobacterium sp. MBR-109 TaxID=3156462 RepID=UPI003394A0BE
MSILNRFNLEGQVAVITGAGRGLGRAIALAYAEAGADIVCSARTLSDVEAVADEVRALGRRALAVSCDVNDQLQREALVASAIEGMGTITHLVNNAGGSGPNDPLKMTPADFAAVLEFNVTSAYSLTQLCVPHMRNAGGGNVINITSGAARYIQKHFSAYGTAKAALTHLTKLLAQDFAPHVRVNAIAPGPIRTAALENAAPAAMLEKMAQNTPLQRIGEPEDIAAAALYFATPASSWVTGKVIEVDGGAEGSVWG